MMDGTEAGKSISFDDGKTEVKIKKEKRKRVRKRGGLFARSESCRDAPPANAPPHRAHSEPAADSRERGVGGA